MISWIDAHCHLADKLFDPSREQLYSDLQQASCKGLVLGGVDPDEWRRQIDLNPAFPIIRSFGLHPWTVDGKDELNLESDFQELKSLLPQADACGEIGLDYYRSKTREARQRQQQWFTRQLELALALRKPLILHIVRAHHDSLPLLKARGGHGLIHSFWGNSDIAKQYIDMGWILSLPPRIMQHDNYELLKELPRERLVFESDSPDELKDGTRTTPLHVLDLFAHAAKTWQEDIDTVIERQNRILEQIFPQLG